MTSRRSDGDLLHRREARLLARKPCASEGRFGQARKEPSRNGLLGLLRRCFHLAPLFVELYRLSQQGSLIPGNHERTGDHSWPCYAVEAQQIIRTKNKLSMPTEPRSQNMLRQKVGSVCRCPTAEHAGPRRCIISCHRGKQTPQAQVTQPASKARDQKNYCVAIRSH